MSEDALPFRDLMERVCEGSSSSSSLKTGGWLSSGPFILLRSKAGWVITQVERRKYEGVILGKCWLSLNKIWVWIPFQPWHTWHRRLQDQFIYRTIRSDGTLTSSWFEDTAISQSLSFANHHIPIQEWATRLPQTETRSNPSRFYPILLLVTNIFWPPYHFNDVYYRNRTILLIFRERDRKSVV